MPNHIVPQNIFIVIKLIELFLTKFHIIVSYQVLDMFSYLLLDHNFPLLKLSKDSILMFQDIYRHTLTNLSIVVINEGQHISSTTI